MLIKLSNAIRGGFAAALVLPCCVGRDYGTLPKRRPPDWESVVTDLATLIEVVEPAIAVSPHPMLNAHLDHQYTILAGLECQLWP